MVVDGCGWLIVESCVCLGRIERITHFITVLSSDSFCFDALPLQPVNRDDDVDHRIPKTTVAAEDLVVPCDDATITFLESCFNIDR